MVTMMSLSLCLYAKLMNSVITVCVAGPNGVKAALVLTSWAWPRCPVLGWAGRGNGRH